VRAGDGVRDGVGVRDSVRVRVRVRVRVSNGQLAVSEADKEVDELVNDPVRKRVLD